MRGLVLCGAFVAVLLAGCGKDGTPPVKPDGGPGGPRRYEAGVDEVTADGLVQAVGGKKPNVVLVEFYSLGDAKTPERVAEAADFHTIKGGFGLDTLLVCVDGPAKKDAALALLTEKKAVGTHYVLADQGKDAAGLADKFGYAGKTPHQAVFARTGARVWKTGDPLDVPIGKGKDGGKGASERDKVVALLERELDQK